MTAVKVFGELQADYDSTYVHIGYHPIQIEVDNYANFSFLQASAVGHLTKVSDRPWLIDVGE